MAEATQKNTRTCIGCGEKARKATMHRIVRTPDGQVRYDATGRAAGRGAYVCSAECLGRALRGKLQHALKCPVDAGDAARIAEELDQALESASAR